MTKISDHELSRFLLLHVVCFFNFFTGFLEKNRKLLQHFIRISQKGDTSSLRRRRNVARLYLHMGVTTKLSSPYTHASGTNSSIMPAQTKVSRSISPAA